jgi:hypothetical protein
MATARVNKYHDDFTQLCGDNKNNNNNGKICAEARRFEKWLHKHQTEGVPDSTKTKIIACIQLLLTAAKSTNDVAVSDAAHVVVETLLKLPEGKVRAASLSNLCFFLLFGVFFFSAPSWRRFKSCRRERYVLRLSQSLKLLWCYFVMQCCFFSLAHAVVKTL